MMQQTLLEFGNSIGLKNLDFNQNKVICLDFNDKGILYLEENGQSLLIYLIKEISEKAFSIYKKSLTLSHFREKLDIPTYRINSGLFEENKLAFIINLPHEEISLPNIDKTIKYLFKLHRNAEQTGN